MRITTIFARAAVLGMVAEFERDNVEGVGGGAMGEIIDDVRLTGFRLVCGRASAALTECKPEDVEREG